MTWQPSEPLLPPATMPVHPAPPSSAGTLLRQGSQFLQRQQLDEAYRCFQLAERINPADPVTHNCLGIVARIQRRLDEASACFLRAITLNPQFAEAHNNLGNTLRDTGNTIAAADCYRRALAIKEEFAEAHNNLGVVMLTAGNHHEALSRFERAIELQPMYAEAHNNLANAYRQRGEFVAATAGLTMALQLSPRSPEIHNNLANVLRETGQTEQACAYYRQAVQLRPDFAEAWENLGTALLDLDRGVEAVVAYEQAARLQGTRLDPLINLGNAYRLIGRTEAARGSYRRAACLDPGSGWHAVRIAALCPPVFRNHAELDQYRTRALTDWPRLAQEQKRRGSLAGDARLVEPEFAWQFLDGNLRPLKEAYADLFGGGWPISKQHAAAATPRVGIVVTRGHEGLFLRSLGGVLQRMQTTPFEIVIVCPAVSEAAIRSAVPRKWQLVLIPESFPEAAQKIQAAQLTVLYFWEIGTDATNYFLPFWQLAPVQCTSWGVQVTSGIRRIDYYLGSHQVESEQADRHYTEQLILAPSLLTYQVPPRLPQSIKTRGDFSFNDQQHLYVCAQQLGKFHPDFDERLAAILRRDGRGHVVVTCDKSGVAAEIVRARWSDSIPDVGDRMHFLPRLAFEDYLQLLNVADVLLDPPHFGGVNSTFDALAVGQPIVTLPTEYQRGRFTAACLRQLGITASIARDPEHYVDLAVELAADRSLQSDVREQIRRSADRVFRDDQAVRAHEQLFDQLVQVSAARH